MRGGPLTAVFAPTARSCAVYDPLLPAHTTSGGDYTFYFTYTNATTAAVIHADPEIDNESPPI